MDEEYGEHFSTILHHFDSYGECFDSLVCAIYFPYYSKIHSGTQISSLRHQIISGGQY